METNKDTKNTNESAWHLTAYDYLLTTAIEKRKENISVIELSKKLDYKRSNIYRMESGSIDLKVSTFLNYLHGFGYHLEIMKDKASSLDVTEDNATNVDITVESGDLSYIIETFDVNKQKFEKKLSKKTRLMLLRSLLKEFEDELQLEEDK